MSSKKKINVISKLSQLFSTGDRILLMDHLKGKGIKQPKEWVLVHSEACGDDELKKDIKPLLAKLNKKHSFTDQFNFAIGIVSRPDEESFLDAGQFRVRYRYGIANDHKGEQLIKDNTREFCSALVRAKKIYRREDINIMSFRGANPIANRNYSIFNLKGHWNCRHAWIREVFVIERDPAETENNPVVEKQTLMKNKKVRAAILKFKKATKGEKLTAEEIVEVNKQLLEDQDFADEKVGDKTLRIDGDIAEGSSVSWIDEEGNMTDVPNGEVTLESGDVLTIADGKISAITEAEVDEEEAAAVEAGKVKAKEEAAKLAAQNKDGVTEEKVGEIVDAAMDKMTTKLEKMFDDIPAFGKKRVKSSFKADDVSDDGKPNKTKRRPNVNGAFKNPNKKED